MSSRLPRPAGSWRAMTTLFGPRRMRMSGSRRSGRRRLMSTLAAVLFLPVPLPVLRCWVALVCRKHNSCWAHYALSPNSVSTPACTYIHRLYVVHKCVIVRAGTFKATVADTWGVAVIRPDPATRHFFQVDFVPTLQRGQEGLAVGDIRLFNPSFSNIHSRFLYCTRHRRRHRTRQY